MRGFTLIEILVVLALASLLAGIALCDGLDSYQQYLSGSDSDTLVALLQHARAEAMNGMCDGATCSTAMAHGVKIQNGQYIFFEGESYDARVTTEDEVFDADPREPPSGLTEVVFEPFSGDDLNPGSIILADTKITISDQGQITWGNK